MKCLIVFFAMLYAISTPCFALSIEEMMTDQLDFSEVENVLPQDIKDILRDYDMMSGQGWDDALDGVKDMVLSSFKQQIESLWQPAIQTLIVIIICGMIYSVFPNDHIEFCIIFAGTAAIIYVCLDDTKSYFTYCIEVIQSSYDFSTVLLPCLAGASVIAGATVSAGVKYTAAALFMNLLLNFSNTILVPLVSIYLSCAVGNAIFQQPILGSVSNMIRWGCITVLSASVIIFTGYMGIAGLLTGAGEMLTTRIAKTTISNGLPIVGKIISDTAATLVAGATMIRNSVGVFGMLAVICILGAPLISVGVRYLLFKFVREISELFLEKRFNTLIKGIEDTYSILFAIVGAAFIMLFLSVMSFMQLVGV